MISKEKLGSLVKTTRLNKGYTQQQLAKKIGISSKQIRNCENGFNYPSMETLNQIINILGIQSSKFFDDKETVDILDKIGKKFSKYNRILDIIEKDKELEDFLYYCVKNKDKVKGIQFTKILKKLSEYSPAERKKLTNIIKDYK